MIKNIKEVKKVSNILSESSKTIEFNNKLPVTVKVLNKIDYTRYSILLGRKEITTKSFKELDVGGNYWAELKSDAKSGVMNLSNLHKKPFVMQKDTLPVAIELDVLLKKVLIDKQPKKFIKEAILEKLALTQDKDEFSFLTNLLFSMHYDILTIPFKVNEKYNLFQMKKSRKGGSNSFSIDFYATFNNLGELNGTILYNNREISLYIKTPFEQTKRFLQEQINELNYFTNVYITKDDVKLLYEFSDKLLDIKG